MRRTIALVAVAAAALSTASCSKKLKLRLRLEKGKSYGVQTTVDQKIDQDMMGQKQSMTQVMSMGNTYKVTDVDGEGNASVDVTYTSVRYKQSGPMGLIDYDSKKPSGAVHPVARGFAGLVGQGFSMELPPDGHARKITGVDKMLDSMAKGLGLPEGPVRQQLKDGMKEQFGETAHQETMKKTFAVYPGDPVEVGDSWTTKVALTKGYPMVAENTYTLKARSGGVATVAVKSKVSPNKDAGPTKMGPMSMKLQLSGTEEGTMEIDEATGWIVGASIRQDIGGKIEI
ncbi:MAG: DUF6263 family protein, partial [Planctomycetota bacterium]